jgi:hypothetical protein
LMGVLHCPEKTRTHTQCHTPLAHQATSHTHSPTAPGHLTHTQPQATSHTRRQWGRGRRHWHSPVTAPRGAPVPRLRHNLNGAPAHSNRVCPHAHPRPHTRTYTHAHHAHALPQSHMDEGSQGRPSPQAEAAETQWRACPQQPCLPARTPTTTHTHIHTRAPRTCSSTKPHG